MTTEENVRTGQIVGIKFERSGRIYAFRAEGLNLRKGELALVESDLGLSMGRVICADFKPRAELRDIKSVLRRPTEEDLDKEEENSKLKAEAFAFGLERIQARGLPMKLVTTDVTLDRKRIIFYFSAESRIDFRELVKDLAAKFKTRIELRQIGVRDATKIMGGMGLCGRQLCCNKFLTTFEPISIKMAKQQELVLNTAKISGMCGRLMCCLGFEYDENITREEYEARHEEDEESVEEAVEEKVAEPAKPAKPMERREPPKPETATQTARPDEQAAGEEKKRNFGKKRRRRRWRKPKK